MSAYSNFDKVNVHMINISRILSKYYKIYAKMDYFNENSQAQLNETKLFVHFFKMKFSQ